MVVCGLVVAAMLAAMMTLTAVLTAGLATVVVAMPNAVKSKLGVISNS